jgi:hypothetical protein
MKSQAPPKPAPPVGTGTFIDRLDPTQRKVLLVGLVFFFFMAASTTLLLAYVIFEPEITSFLQKQTLILNSSPASQPTQQSAIIIPTQTPSCTGASLQLGTNIWRIEAMQRLADGSLNVPEGIPGVAYWITDLENPYGFALSPTPENLSVLSSLQGGEQAILTWETCNTVTYILTAPQAGELGMGQSISGIVVYVPSSTSGAGLSVQGNLEGETITSPPTYAPAPSEVNAEISLLETTTSPDGTTLQVVVSILNYGTGAIALLERDITLTPENAAPLALSKSDPKMPEKIKPGESKTFSLVFPRPDTSIATLKIYKVEYDLEDY